MLSSAEVDGPRRLPCRPTIFHADCQVGALGMTSGTSPGEVPSITSSGLPDIGARKVRSITNRTGNRTAFFLSPSGGSQTRCCRSDTQAICRPV